VGPVLGKYLDQNIYEADLFVTLDREGVGALMRIAAESGRASRSGLELGICGEHGGDFELTRKGERRRWRRECQSICWRG
jgi:phosphoenolpyruvate synthase/pyruvate phosphate dikinase